MAEEDDDEAARASRAELRGRISRRKKQDEGGDDEAFSTTKARDGRASRQEPEGLLEERMRELDEEEKGSGESE